MKAVVGEPETLQGANVLDESVRGIFEKITPVDIIGALAQDQGFGGGDEQMAWLRPAVGAEPAMRLSALVQMAGDWGGTQLVALRRSSGCLTAGSSGSSSTRSRSRSARSD